MNNIDLSVIIPVYNAMPLLKRTLDSIFNQKTKYSYEVILVDDGSKDNSVEYIKLRQETNVVLLQQQNAGPARARNNGVEHANGRYCAYLDADDFWEDTFIEKVVEFLDDHDECVAVSVAQKHLTVSGESISPACINNYKNPFVLEDFFTFWGEWMHVCTGSVCIRTEVIRQVGGQREDLRIAEDLEFWGLVSTYGKWGIIPDVLFTSDGTVLIKDNAAWKRKMQPRWNNAPSVEEWQQRIVSRIGDNIPEGFKKARGRIASMFVYSHIMSNRFNLARRDVKDYGEYFPKNKATSLIKLASMTYFTWWLLCKFLHVKESLRFK